MDKFKRSLSKHLFATVNYGHFYSQFKIQNKFESQPVKLWPRLSMPLFLCCQIPDLLCSSPISKINFKYIDHFVISTTIFNKKLIFESWQAAFATSLSHTEGNRWSWLEIRSKSPCVYHSFWDDINLTGETEEERQELSYRLLLQEGMECS